MFKKYFILSLILLFLTVACSGTNKIIPKPFAAPSEYKLIYNVPFFPDETNLCGPSTLAALMSYNGRETTVEEATENIFRKDTKGSFAPDMVIWARETGLKATFFQGSPELLIEKVNKRQPVIVQLDTGISLIKKGHFAVVVGYGPDGIIVNSGSQKKLILPWGDFLSSWLRSSYLTITVERNQTSEEIEFKEKIQDIIDIEESLKTVPKIDIEL